MPTGAVKIPTRVVRITKIFSKAKLKMLYLYFVNIFYMQKNKMLELCYQLLFICKCLLRRLLIEYTGRSLSHV